MFFKKKEPEPIQYTDYEIVFQCNDCKTVVKSQNTELSDAGILSDGKHEGLCPECGGLNFSKAKVARQVKTLITGGLSATWVYGDWEIKGE